MKRTAVGRNYTSKFAILIDIPVNFTSWTRRKSTCCCARNVDSMAVGTSLSDSSTGIKENIDLRECPTQTGKPSFLVSLCF